MGYEYAVGDCDVLDKDALSKYRRKRGQWLHLMQGDPDHAVWRQIHSMLWNDAVFRMTNEARRLAREGGYPSSARNYSIAQFMDQGFVATQTLSIRKLTEKAWTRPNRQIISLRRVIDDIKAHRRLITREIFVAYDGLPYETEVGRRKQFGLAEDGVLFDCLATTGPEAWDSAELAHERFDELSGIAANLRLRSDLIKEDVFSNIDKLLKDSGWEDLIAYGNKFIAHAADEHSRGTLLEGQEGLSLDRLAQCHEGICRAAATIFGTILYEGQRGMIPIAPFNHFDNLDAPWLSRDDVKALSRAWKARIEKIEAWAEDN